MKLKLICCGMISREMQAAVSHSTHRIEVAYLPAALHTEGAEPLRRALEAAVGGVVAGFDAVLLGFGLCGNGLHGLRAGSIPMVVPRAHDCITLLMGSRRRYNEYFSSHPGVYFLSTGWMEEGRGIQPGWMESTPGPRAGWPEENAPRQPAGPARSLSGYALNELIAKYGEDNGRYLYEMLSASETQYRQFTFIETGLENDPACALAAKEEADRRGWSFEKFPGDLALFRKMVDGAWDADAFVVVPPGKRLVATYDDAIFGIAD